eukprot:gb/GFBE01030968.1/.p1 GENE.gb/GFBE01030968.1/~~gb/GFBE01030968.1/.p1  ORF type:complete len:334 (+),score=41.62 gb/GFBE01030968.1/:1-1002(+)
MAPVEGLPVSTSSLLWLLTPRTTGKVKPWASVTAVELLQADDQDASSELPETPRRRHAPSPVFSSNSRRAASAMSGQDSKDRGHGPGTPAPQVFGNCRSSTPVADFHAMRMGQTRSGYRAPDTSHRGAPPRPPLPAPLRTPEAFGQLGLSEGVCAAYLQELGENVWAASSQEACDADREVESIALAGARAKREASWGRRRMRISPPLQESRCSGSAKSPSHANRVSPRWSADDRSTRTPASGWKSPASCGSCQTSTCKKEVWKEMVDEKRRLWKERCEVFRNMRSMPFAEWDRQKEIRIRELQAQKEQEMSARQAAAAAEQAAFGGLGFALRH